MLIIQRLRRHTLASSKGLLDPPKNVAETGTRRGERFYNILPGHRHRIPVPGQHIVLRVPEISVRVVIFRLLLLFLNGGEAFRFLVSHPVTRRIGGFTAGEERGAND
jgi:hypothetical protein